MKFISLFAGIGGLDLGLERAGMECVAQVEIDDFFQRVLQKHWPDVPKFKDVKDVGKHNLPKADAIVGGFPCQPHSTSGKQKEELHIGGAGSNGDVANATGERLERQTRTGLPNQIASGGSWWTTEPGVCGVDNGASDRVDRLRGLGNAVVPQVAEFIGRSIIEIDRQFGIER